MDTNTDGSISKEEATDFVERLRSEMRENNTTQ
jgi:polyhydroxyalkanoate synthesis regulator phasin